MKKYILFSATLFLLSTVAFPQVGTYGKKWYMFDDSPGMNYSNQLMYEVRGKYARPVKKESLNLAKTLSDFIPGYPSNWISDYISVGIWTTNNGKAMNAMGKNEVLTTEQKNLIKTADLSSNIVVEVSYNFKNPVTDKVAVDKTHTTMTLIPDIEAEYVGGYQKLIKYLEATVMNKITESTDVRFQHGIVQFSINEKGEVVDAKISLTSDDPKTDKLLLDAINKMPNWKPAENLNGIKVKQEFEFSVGRGGC